MRSGLVAAALAQVAAGPAGAQAAGHTVQLSKVILDNSGNEVKGHLKVGTICLFGGGPIRLNDRKVTQDHERFNTLFTRVMKDRGYPVVSADDDLFAGETAPKGDYLVGATMHLEQVDLCSSVKGEKGTLTLTVEWKLFDRASQKVVAAVTTTGHGAQEKFAADGLSRMVDAAFAEGLRAMVEQAPAREVLGAPPAATASAGKPL